LPRLFADRAFRLCTIPQTHNLTTATLYTYNMASFINVYRMTSLSPHIYAAYTDMQGGQLPRTVISS